MGEDIKPSPVRIVEGNPEMLRGYGNAAGKRWHDEWREGRGITVAALDGVRRGYVTSGPPFLRRAVPDDGADESVATFTPSEPIGVSSSMMARRAAREAAHLAGLIRQSVERWFR